jgi:predicted secreted protein
MITLKANSTDQSFKCFPRYKEGAGTYTLKVKDQQTGTQVTISSLTATEVNRSLTIDFTFTATDGRWYTIHAYKEITGVTYEIFRGVAYSYDHAQNPEIFSIYYDYNTTPSDNDNTYLTL